MNNSDTLTLQSLYQQIQTKIQSGAGTFNLVPDVLDADNPIGKFYIDLIPGGVFTISKSVLQPATWDDSLTQFTLLGESSSFGTGNMQLSMIFSDTATGILSDLKSVLVNGTWPIAGISWFTLSNPFVGIQVYNTNLPVIGKTGGIVNVNSDIVLELAMSYPVAADTWLLQGSFESPYPSISNFYQMVGGVNLKNALPQPFSTLTDLGLKQLDFSYDTKASLVKYIAIAISTDPDYQWQILPKLAISNIGITALVQNPLTQNTATTFTISGDFTIGAPDSNLLVVTTTFPNFTSEISLDSGTIQLGDLLTIFWSGTTIDLQSEIVALYVQIAPDSKNYTLNCVIVSNWVFFNISNPDLSFTMTGLSLDISSQQGLTTGKIVGTFHIGPSTPDTGVDLNIYAGYDGVAWSFGASTGTNQTISLGDIAYTFLTAFGMEDIPSWVSDNLPEISNVSFDMVVPDDKNKLTTYKIKGDVAWHLQFSSFNLELSANVDIAYSDGKTSGTITGIADARQMLGLTFLVGYKFGTPDTEVYLKIPEFASTITYTSGAKNDIIDIKFDKISLGEIISTLVGTFSPGFSLPAPWNLLDSIDLSGFEFKYTRYKDSAQSSIVASIPINVDLGFINIKAIKITKDDSITGSGVYMYFDGTFLLSLIHI